MTDQHNAETNSGAIAQGEKAAAASGQSAAVSGDVHGDVNVGHTKNVTAGQDINARDIITGTQNFYNIINSPPPVTLAELLVSVQQASTELRTYDNEIAGIHLERAEVEQIVTWVLNPDSNKRLGMLLDQPGEGKTVVMRDVLVELEAKGIPVLAIKADYLSGIQSHAELADRLGLPASVEECVKYMATNGLIVVLLDQLDALSLTLSRDQATLNLMLSMLSRLRNVDNVRVVASCRTFDLRHDPRLSTITVDNEFKLQPIHKDQVDQVLHRIGVDPARLLARHLTLLRTPLHLSIYAQIVDTSETASIPESFHTLQELYGGLWQKRVKSAPRNISSPHKAIYHLVDVMQRRRQTAAPEGVLDDYSEAASYLESVGFLRREKGNWLFLHQTLYDYCYARHFVAQEGLSLSEKVLNGSQGLFERSQMVQVLAYLRGDQDAIAYHRTLKNLLFANDLRRHLRLLLINWFGSLPTPTDDELSIARHLLKNPDHQLRFLQAAGGNPDWFDRLNESLLPSLLETDNEQLVEAIVDYLGRAINVRTDTVLARLRPYLGQGDIWDARIASCLWWLEDWHSPEALEILCDLLKRGRGANWPQRTFHRLATSNPAAGCVAARVYLDWKLDDWSAQNASTQQNTSTWGELLLDEYGIEDIVEKAVEVSPGAVIEHLLPWFIRVTDMTAAASKTSFSSDEYYPSDSLFASGWYGGHLSKEAVFALRISHALGHLAQTKPADFRAIATELAAIEVLAVQRVLVKAYLFAPEVYADDIFAYLLADPRRLAIGEPFEDPRYHSQSLYGAVFPHLESQQRITLERLILNLQPAREYQNLNRRGLTQLRFLKSVDDPNLLSQPTRRKLQELERKFPDFEICQPRGVVTGWVGPPIDQDAQAKMSDADWLGAMHKYNDSGYQSRDLLKGGARELASSFTEQTKTDPERFYHLALNFDETISGYYITAAVSGLADAEAPADWMFDLIRKFAARFEGEFRRNVGYSLEKRAEAGVPDDLLDLITDWALNDPDPTEELWQIPTGSNGQPYYGGDPHMHGLNSNRGMAVRVSCYCALKRDPAQVERAFQLLEKMANDLSIAVRTCVIEVIAEWQLLLQSNDARTLAVFTQTLDGHPILLRSPLAHRFLHWTTHKHFDIIRPIIEHMLVDNDDATCQAGARLVCLGAFWYDEAKALETRVMSGQAALRRGAAQVYAHNLANPKLRATCRERLRQLMTDSDEQVRIHVGECFEFLNPEHLDDLRDFIDEFLKSPALPLGIEPLLNYLGRLAVDEHDLALMATQRILDTVGAEIVDIHSNRKIVRERDVVRLPLTIYTHTDDPEIQSQAMTLFEHLLELGSYHAWRALEDWDRQ